MTGALLTPLSLLSSPSQVAVVKKFGITNQQLSAGMAQFQQDPTFNAVMQQCKQEQDARFSKLGIQMGR
jgi:hypothetical protein